MSAATFAHGVHPPTHKEETRDAPIRQFPFAPVMAIPLSQHIGRPALPVVREGQEVLRGQCIAEPDGETSVAMHAPATGTRLAAVSAWCPTSAARWCRAFTWYRRPARHRKSPRARPAIRTARAPGRSSVPYSGLESWVWAAPRFPPTGN
ncbi:MAG: hypothetical protein U5K56_13365 [Halioglobus sp.]|nr:hypothetical protein [Halioglobus sp.]